MKFAVALSIGLAIGLVSGLGVAAWSQSSRLAAAEVGAASMKAELAEANQQLARLAKRDAHRRAADEKAQAEQNAVAKTFDVSSGVIIHEITNTFAAGPIDKINDELQNLNLKAGVRVQFTGQPNKPRLITVAIDSNKERGIEVAQIVASVLTNDSREAARFIQLETISPDEWYRVVASGQYANIEVNSDDGTIEFTPGGRATNR